MLVEREVGHEARQPVVLLLELPQAPHLVRPEMRELLLPDVERGLAHAQLAADIRDGGAALGLLEGVGDLFFGESGLLQRVRAPGWGPRREPTLRIDCRRIRGPHH